MLESDLLSDAAGAATLVSWGRSNTVQRRFGHTMMFTLMANPPKVALHPTWLLIRSKPFKFTALLL